MRKVLYVMRKVFAYVMSETVSKDQRMFTHSSFLLPAMYDDRPIGVPIGLRGFLDKSQELSCRIWRTMVGPRGVVEMKHVSLGTIFVVDQVFSFQTETLEPQNPQGVGLLYVVAHQGHLDATIDCQEAFIGPILIALQLQ